MAWLPATPYHVSDPTGDERWMDQHNQHLHHLSTMIDSARVAFIGDTHVQLLRMFDTWHRRCVAPPLHALNFGICGDQTQHILWRVLRLKLDTLKMLKVVVVMAGSSNDRRHTAQDIAGGVMSIVSAIQEQVQQVHVLVVSLLPRGKYPNPLRTKNSEVNYALAQRYGSELATSHVHFIEVSDELFMDMTSLEIPNRLMYDWVHLSADGYDIFLDVLIPHIRAYVGVSAIESPPPPRPPQTMKLNVPTMLTTKTIPNIVSLNEQITNKHNVAKHIIEDFKELRALQELIPKRNRINSFNEEPLCSKLRLNSSWEHLRVREPAKLMQPLDYSVSNVKKRKSKQFVCIVCRSQGRRTKTSTLCGTCTVPLCISPKMEIFCRDGTPMDSCYDYWHSAYRVDGGDRTPYDSKGTVTTERNDGSVSNLRDSEDTLSYDILNVSSIPSSISVINNNIDNNIPD